MEMHRRLCSLLRCGWPEPTLMGGLLKHPPIVPEPLMTTRDKESKARKRARMPGSLLSVLEACDSLPRPPGIAFRILRRTRDPEATTNDIAEVVAADPVLAARIVRMANSPMYAQQREVGTLARAITVLGFEATGSAAVAISVVGSLGNSATDGDLDCQLFWRRSLLAAMVGKVLASGLHGADPDEVFLACLLQDIGMLALARAVPGLYSGTEDDQLHQELLIAREHDRCGADHSIVGAWMVDAWKFPDEIQQGILASHDLEGVSDESDAKDFCACVAVSSAVAEAFLERSGQRRIGELAVTCHGALGLGKDGLLDVLRRVAELIPEFERVYEVGILLGIDSEEAVAEAAEALGLTAPASALG